MKLYYSPGACSLASHIVLREMELPFDLEPVNLKTKHYKGGDFLQVNPKGYVPCLQTEDGQILTEGIAILLYLADRKPEKRMAPERTSPDRYRILEWLAYIST